MYNISARINTLDIPINLAEFPRVKTLHRFLHLQVGLDLILEMINCVGVVDIQKGGYISFLKLAPLFIYKTSDSCDRPLSRQRIRHTSLPAPLMLNLIFHVHVTYIKVPETVKKV